ncbi:M23 family metallopeptidase [Candidatus Thioglobus sp.]|nr:M23 family metallopeptidase [Candidatus Thioglobus sp.]
MHTKYLILFLSLILSGCLTNEPGQVTVVEKSFNNVLNDNQNNSKAKVVSGSKNWSLPVAAEILKKFSIENNHPGLTYNSALGQDVRAVRNGEVVYSGDKMASYGKMIIIKHAYGFYSIYNQNQELYVSEGDSIEKGQVIAITGNKPFYFEMKKYEEPINPLKYL